MATLLHCIVWCKQSCRRRFGTWQVTGELFPRGVGYRSFFYRDTLGRDSIAAVGAYGQMCYVSPTTDVVIALFSTAHSDFKEEEAFAKEIALEEFRWNFCRRLCEFIAN